MINTKDTVKLLEISSRIIELIDNRDEIPNGDFQGCIEAQVMSAYLLGQKSE